MYIVIILFKKNQAKIMCIVSSCFTDIKIILYVIDTCQHIYFFISLINLFSYKKEMSLGCK